jgi:hypothetical protein
MINTHMRLSWAAVFLFLFAGAAGAENTRVTVRVLAKDAKFVGTGMGGARVTIRAADTGELLARGRTEGGTGNTALLMTQPVARRTSLADEGSAKVTLDVDIDAPTRVVIEATGPLAQRQAEAKASVTQWLIPGKHVVEGNAVLLELPGFVVDVLEPPAHSELAGPQDVEIRINLTMM